jgi:hypothetical protein
MQFIYFLHCFDITPPLSFKVSRSKQAEGNGKPKTKELNRKIHRKKERKKKEFEYNKGIR